MVSAMTGAQRVRGVFAAVAAGDADGAAGLYAPDAVIHVG